MVKNRLAEKLLLPRSQQHEENKNETQPKSITVAKGKGLIVKTKKYQVNFVALPIGKKHRDNYRINILIKQKQG